MPTEEEIHAMFDVQKVTLARAALAGITYEKVTDEVRHIPTPGRRQRGEWLQITKIRAKWPSGAYVSAQSDLSNDIREFDDEYEAALYCLSCLDNDGSRPSPPLPAGFTLKPENEQ